MDVLIDVSGVTITTGRLILRPLTLADAQDFYAYASVPGVGEMAGWKHHESTDESKAILRSMMEGKEVLALVHKADQKVIGTLGLHPSWANEAEAYRQYRVKEIGYVLSKDYWGQGLMPEAVGAVIAYCFDTLGLDALTCCHFTENGQSRRVIEKCGFRFVRTGEFVSERLHKTFEDKQYILIRNM
ncbi:MAG: GNAT family N-acetyltransferase [Bacillota bacterium]